MSTFWFDLEDGHSIEVQIHAATTLLRRDVMHFVTL